MVGHLGWNHEGCGRQGERDWEADRGGQLFAWCPGELGQVCRAAQFSSVAQSCPTLCDPTNCSTPGLPVRHQLPEFTQTHVHRVSAAIQIQNGKQSCWMLNVDELSPSPPWGTALFLLRLFTYCPVVCPHRKILLFIEEECVRAGHRYKHLKKWVHIWALPSLAWLQVRQLIWVHFPHPLSVNK